FVGAGRLVHDPRADEIVPFFDDVGADGDEVSDDALDWISTAVELGGDALDDEVFDAARVGAPVGLSCSHVGPFERGNGPGISRPGVTTRSQTPGPGRARQARVAMCGRLRLDQT